MGWPHLRLLYTLCPLGALLSDLQQVLNGITWLLCVGIQGWFRLGLEFSLNPTHLDISTKPLITGKHMQVWQEV